MSTQVAELTLSDIRKKATGFAVLYLWAHVPLIAVLAWWNDSDTIPLTVAMALFALLVTVDRRRNPVGESVQLAAAAAMAVTVGMIVYILAGHLWQIDMHMYFFAAFALTAVFCNWKVILVYAGVVAVHHLALNFLLPVAVFPEGADFWRVVLHAVIVVVQAVALVWLVVTLERAFAASEQALDAVRAANEESRRMSEENQLAQQKAQEQRQAERLRLAQTFETDVSTAITQLNDAMETARKGIAEALTFNETLDRSASTVGDTAQSLNGNIQLVATATEELTASASEVGQRMAETLTMARDAGEASKLSEEKGQALADASHRIEEVIGLIAEIADQTNLLALNATIEAARAGDAGKGFAVVASEVKNLAEQTARATEDVRNEVNAIVSAIDAVNGALQAVTDKNREMSGVFESVSSAVEEQLSSTREIAVNTQRAAVETSEMTEAMVGMQKTTEDASHTMSTVQDVTGRLESVVRTVDERSRAFLTAVRA